MSQEPDAEVTAVYELPVPIWVSCAILGQTYPSGLGGLRFDAVMPLDQQPFGAAPVIEGVNVPDQNDDGELVEWTTKYAAWIDEEREPATALRHIVITAVKAPEDRERSWRKPQHQIAERIGPWFDRVRTWAELYTGQDLDPSHRLYDAETIGDGLTFVSPDNQGATGLRLTTNYVVPVSAGQWSKILSNVRDGVEAPLELLLHRDARAAESRGFYRRAVIDAAASVEIPLNRILAARSAELPEKQLARFNRKPSLGTLISIARDSGVTLGVPFEDLETLSRVRNEAVHRAQAPSFLEAHQLVCTASDFLSSDSVPHPPTRNTPATSPCIG